MFRVKSFKFFFTRGYSVYMYVRKFLGYKIMVSWLYYVFFLVCSDTSLDINLLLISHHNSGHISCIMLLSAYNLGIYLIKYFWGLFTHISSRSEFRYKSKYYIFFCANQLITACLTYLKSKFTIQFNE